MGGLVGDEQEEDEEGDDVVERLAWATGGLLREAFSKGVVTVVVGDPLLGGKVARACLRGLSIWPDCSWRRRKGAVSCASRLVGSSVGGLCCL